MNHAGGKISKQAKGISIASSPDDGRWPETRPDIDRSKDPDGLLFTAHYRANLIDLQFCNFNLCDLSVIKPLAGSRCPFQPAIHCIPGKLLDSGNRGFVESFDTESCNLVEGRSSVLKPMINRAVVPAEGFAATGATESATAAPPGAIETIPNNDFGPGLLSGTQMVGAAETLHSNWTRSLAGVVTLKIGLKSYHTNGLQSTRQH